MNVGRFIHLPILRFLFTNTLFNANKDTIYILSKKRMKNNPHPCSFSPLIEYSNQYNATFN